MKISLILALSLPLQAGIVLPPDDAPPEEQAVAASFADQMLAFARHNEGLCQFLEEPDIEAIVAGERDEAAYGRALARFVYLMPEKPSLPEYNKTLRNVLVPVASAYALRPERRPQLERFLREGLAQSPCRELCLLHVLEQAVLSPANRELAEKLFRDFDFSLETLAQQWKADERAMSLHLLKACLDIDSPALATRLAEQGALPDPFRNRAAIELYRAAMPYTPAERAADFKQNTPFFFRNNDGYHAPLGDFLQRARLERGLSRAWDSLPWVAAGGISPAARAAVMVEGLLPLLQNQAAAEGRPGLRPVHLWLDEDGGGMLRCVDMAAEVSPAALALDDYELSLRPTASLYPATVDDEDSEDDEEEEEDDKKPEIRQDACLAQLKACYEELPAVLELMTRSREIPEELVGESRDSFGGGLAGKAFLAELGLVAVNDPQKPWRWGATFYLPYEGGGGYTSCPFILADGKWKRSPNYLCYYFASNELRDSEHIGKSRINCLCAPELSDKGKEVCREYAQYRQERAALLAQRAGLLRAVQDRAGADAAVAPLKQGFAAEKELERRSKAVWDAFNPDEEVDEDGNPWYRELTREEFAPENDLQGMDLERLLGLEGDGSAYGACQKELERLHDVGFCGSESLKDLLEPELYLNQED